VVDLSGAVAVRGGIPDRVGSVLLQARPRRRSRRDRIARGVAALDQLNTRLASARTRIKTAVAVEQAATAALDHAGATRWIGFRVTEQVEETVRQEKRGRPGKNTRYRKLTRTHHRVAFTVREDAVARDAASDGCYPLITDDQLLSVAPVGWDGVPRRRRR
jgi:hypothetical protein